jgi:hypothetical protein
MASSHTEPTEPANDSMDEILELYRKIDECHAVAVRLNLSLTGYLMDMARQSLIEELAGTNAGTRAAD